LDKYMDADVHDDPDVNIFDDIDKHAHNDHDFFSVQHPDRLTDLHTNPHDDVDANL